MMGFSRRSRKETYANVKNNTESDIESGMYEQCSWKTWVRKLSYNFEPARMTQRLYIHRKSANIQRENGTHLPIGRIQLLEVLTKRCVLVVFALGFPLLFPFSFAFVFCEASL